MYNVTDVVYASISIGYWLNFDVVSGVDFGNGRVPGGVGSVVVDRYQRLQYRFV